MYLVYLDSFGFQISVLNFVKLDCLIEEGGCEISRDFVQIHPNGRNVNQVFILIY